MNLLGIKNGVARVLAIRLVKEKIKYEAWDVFPHVLVFSSDIKMEGKFNFHPVAY